MKNLLKKIIVIGAAILGTVAPAYANEMEVEAPVSAENVIEQEVEIVEYRLEMTKEEWNEFVLENGWDNVQFVTTEGEYMVFEAFKCGVKTADIYLKELVHEPATLPEEEGQIIPDAPVEENNDLVTLPEEEGQIVPDAPVEENNDLVTLPEEEGQIVPDLPIVEEEVIVVEEEVVVEEVVVEEVEAPVNTLAEVEDEVVYNTAIYPKTGDSSMIINFIIIVITLTSIVLFNRKKRV